MIVKDCMHSQVTTCHPDDNAEYIALQMWQHDYGLIPVVDNNKRVTGVITDRDICMCSAMNHKPMWDIKPEEITHGRQIHSCRPEDDIKTALNTMKTAQLHRLPVINEKQQLVGIIGLGDVLSHTSKAKKQIPLDDTINTLKGIYAPH